MEPSKAQQQGELLDVESALQALALGPTDSHTLTALANASRESASVRKQLGTSSILNSLIAIVRSCLQNGSYGTLKLALRCLGNGCADNDAARDLITSSHGFSWASSCLQASEDETKFLTTKVLLNICTSHAASQLACYRERVHYDLLRILGLEKLEGDCSIVIDLTFLIISHKSSTEEALDDPLPVDLLRLFLDLPTKHLDADVEDFMTLLQILCCFYKDATVQTQIVNERLFNSLQRTSGRTINRARIMDPENQEDAEDLKVLIGLCTALVWYLSDIAAHPDFAKVYSLEDEEIRTPIDYILVRNTSAWAIGKNDHWKKTSGLVLIVACEIVGNLLWKTEPESFSCLVEKEHLEKALFAEIVRAETGQEAAATIHSVAGLLIQLSRPSPSVREILGADELALPALEKLCRYDMQQIKEDGIKLLRALGRECPSNQRRFFELGKEVMLSTKESSDATETALAPS